MKHGGNILAYGRETGCDPLSILDFSANMNPLGPPSWLREAVSGALACLAHYPDPECRSLVAAASRRYGVPEAEIVAANGTSELISLLPRLSGLSRAVIPTPAYGEYAAACELAGLGVERLPLDEARDFAPDFARLGELLARSPALVFLGHPNNPTGGLLDVPALRALCEAYPDSLFAVDEAFADFCESPERLVAERPENVVVLLSLTKFYALPGLRLGLAAAAPGLAGRLRAHLPPWSVNTLAQIVGSRALADDDYAARTRVETSRLRERMLAEIATLPGVAAYPGEANFLLCRLERGGLTARDLHAFLLPRGAAIRVCDSFGSLSPAHFRLAVRPEAEQDRLFAGLAEFLHARRAPAPRPTPALMLQGVSSDAGKSVLAAAFCRALFQDGFSPAPFKAQNMSLNSCVTPDGLEMGRAQVTQAQACRLTPDARMNPVLLKPTSDVGSQIVVLGKPTGAMRAVEYYRHKAGLWPTVTRAYDELAAGAGVMVLEGAGSPAEVNLKRHDIVNMAMARHASARVLLVADIDRGGAFASLVGCMDCLDESERALVGGHILNKFRGDASLLADALDFTRRFTGRPVLGTMPMLQALGLPEEDSVAYKAGRTLLPPSTARDLDVAVVDLPHVSNFTDLDALTLEPDVSLRIVRDAASLGSPDLVILPGSKNTLGDLDYLRSSSLAEAVLALEGRAVIVGICGGLQILGRSIADPHGLESARGELSGLGLLPLSTVLAPDKTLTRVRAVHAPSGFELDGYEIHHGRTETTESVPTPVLAPDGRPLAWTSPDGSILGTYLHGFFDADAFRRRFLDDLRVRKGLAPLGGVTARYDIEPALDRLADALREHVDVAAVYRMLGIG